MLYQQQNISRGNIANLPVFHKLFFSKQLVGQEKPLYGVKKLVVWDRRSGGISIYNL
jgi:hypothetical protein